MEQDNLGNMATLLATILVAQAVLLQELEEALNGLLAVLKEEEEE